MLQDGCGSTALHVATEDLIDADQETGDRLVECVGLLLQVDDLEVNAEDMKSESTALQYAALAAHTDCVDLLLSHGANLTPEIETLIRDKIPDFDPQSFKTAKRGGRPLKNILFNMIEMGDNVQGLENYVSGRDNVDWNADNGQFTLLQYACDLGRDKIVEYLLDQGARYDGSGTASNSEPACVIAASHGYYKVLRVFIDKLPESELKSMMMLTDDYHGKRTILHQVVRRSSAKIETGNTENMDYEQCLKLLLDEKTRLHGRKSGKNMARLTERIINFKDSYGETVLHYATQQPNQEIIKLLLKHGANMGVKNNEGKAPVSRILPETLDDFFNSCVEPQGIITDDKFKMTFNYNFLAPPLLDAEILDEFEEKKHDLESLNVTNPRPETEALWYMSESSQHRPLLKHPVISSFLWMKWQRIRSFYYLGLFLSFLFVALLTTFIMLEYGGCSIKPVNSCDEEVSTSVLRILIGVFVVGLFGIEIIQLAVSFKRYVASVENVIQNLVLIGIVVLIADSSLGFETGRHIAATLLVCSWVGFLIYFGLHPSLNTKKFMLYTVAWSFITFLAWYIFIIVAFGFSFYIMFHTDHKNGEPNEEYPFFDNIGSCLVKSFAMFVGELEFSDIPFTSNVLSYLIFILFIFFIVVVLMNLLNGLAVSDIAIIKEEAEVLSLKSQVDLISYWESILLNDPYNFLTSWPKMMASLPSLSCCFWIKKLPGCATLWSKVSGGTKILLFYQCLPHKTATFYPNKRLSSCNPYKKRVRVEPECQGDSSPGLEVSKHILEAAKMLILNQQRTNQSEDQLSVKVSQLEAKIDKLLQSLNIKH